MVGILPCASDTTTEVIFPMPPLQPATIEPATIQHHIRHEPVVTLHITPGSLNKPVVMSGAAFTAGSKHNLVVIHYIIAGSLDKVSAMFGPEKTH